MEFLTELLVLERVVTLGAVVEENTVVLFPDLFEVDREGIMGAEEDFIEFCNACLVPFPVVVGMGVDEYIFGN